MIARTTTSAEEWKENFPKKDRKELSAFAARFSRLQSSAAFCSCGPYCPTVVPEPLNDI